MAQCLYCLSGLYSPLVVLETVGKMATDYARRIAMPRGTRRIDMLLQYLEVPGTLICQSLTVALQSQEGRRIAVPGALTCQSLVVARGALLCPMV